MNAEHIKTSPPVRISEALVPLLEGAGLKEEIQAVSKEWLAQLVVLVKERAKTLVEMVDWVLPYFGQAVTLDEEAAKKFLTPGIAPVLSKLLIRFEAIPVFLKQQWEEAFKQLVEEEGIKMGQLAQPVRLALTGRTASPGLFEVMEVLGRDRTLFRLRQGIERASQHREHRS
jgi:glutamyl-tRNA synthetase